LERGGERMLLTMKEKNKIEVIQAVMDGRVGVSEAGRVLRKTERTIYRMLKRLREEGLEGLIHGNRGRKSPRRIRESLRKRLIVLAKGKYKDINDTQLSEILLREKKISLTRETLRRILREANVGPKRKRRRPKYRSRRERKSSFGIMLQLDGSRHDWLEGRGPWMTLVGGIDDATNYAWAHFFKAETTWAYLTLMRGIASSHGLPISLYSDRHTIFHAPREQTIIEQLHDMTPLTQFGRAMNELGIEIIKAWSAPAKGRIERLWGTLQDRLIVEMRLQGVRTLDQANGVLAGFLKEHNRRFTVAAIKNGSLFRKAPPLSKLDRILCLKETRTVNKDHTISFEGLILQIPPAKQFRSLAKRKVRVLQLSDGSVEIVYKQMTVARFRAKAITRIIGNKQDERRQLKKAA
jgi:transposase